MKKVLGWVKSNLIVVIVMLVAVLAIPAMLFFSMKWNGSIRDDVSDQASKTLNKLNGISVTYEIPAMMTGGEAWSLRSAPNAAMNDQMEKTLKRLAKQAEEVRTLAVDRNSAGKTLLVDGEGVDQLFPAPDGESARVKLLTELTRARPDAYAELLKDARAGMPPDHDQLTLELETERIRERERMVGNRVDQDLDEQELEQISQTLAEKRLDFYNRRAASIAMYADSGAFVGVGPWPEDQGLPSLSAAWEWQMQYWVTQDVVAALKKANSDSTRPWIQVAWAPVKRVLSIEVAPSKRAGNLLGDDKGGSVPTDSNAEITPTYAASFTGRAGWPDNPNALYDIRYATVKIIADTNRLPVILDAFATTNFMTVVGLQLRAIDPQEALADGFVYGGDAVTQATIRVESIWLRSWMKQWMPKPVRERMGIPDDPEPESDDGAEQE